MRVAVITPYYREASEILQKCHESVQDQTHPCTHFMVADGFPREEIADWTIEHIILSKAHNDSGNTPRCIGSLSSMNLGYDAIAYLDADNWFYPNHIESMVDLHKKTGAAVCTATRTIHRWDESLMFVDKHDSDGKRHVDTSCLFITRQGKGDSPNFADHASMAPAKIGTVPDTKIGTVPRDAFSVLPLWAMMPKELAPVCDRVMWQAILARGMTHAHHPQPTVAFRTQYQFHYALLKETPPPGTKSHDESVGKATKWWNTLPADVRMKYL